MKHGPVPTMEIGEARELSREDLARLAEGKRVIQSVPQRLRSSHHNIARLAAAGLNNKVIAERTGYTKERVSQLINSPAMEELIARYRDKIDESFHAEVDTYMELAIGNMVAAERHIADRIDQLDEEGELLPLRDAIAVSRDAADRFGYGKRQTNVNVNTDFASLLEARIAKSGVILDQGSTTPPPGRPLLVEMQPLARPREARAAPQVASPPLRRRA